MEAKETATRVSLVPDTQALLKGASLKPTNKKSQTVKPKKAKSKSNFDKDTSDEEEDMDITEEMDITGSLSENETEEGEPTEEEGDNEIAGEPYRRTADRRLNRMSCSTSGHG